jgi:hypothetical protein
MSCGRDLVSFSFVTGAGSIVRIDEPGFSTPLGR